MNPLRQAAQQALEALHEIAWCNDSRWQTDRAESVIPALRDALEQQEQEPVAWMVYTQDGKSLCVTDNPADFTDEHRALPLYTHPPRREWRSLSEDELTALGVIHSRYQEESLETGGWFDFARAIEQVCKERNT
jgi:hypothetical protein